MIRTIILDDLKKPTAEQLKEIEEAKKYPIVFDEDCPELSPAMLRAMKIAAAERIRRKNA